MLIAIEGIDGSGKGTQARSLVDRLEVSGRKTALLSFPRYGETLFGRAIGEFLNGRFGTLDQVHPFLASLLYAGDRFESRGVLAEALASNDIVVLDRYVASNLAHQGAKLSGAERRELLDRVKKIEHELYGLPIADLTLLLALPAALAQTLIAKKAKRNYTEKAADLQEADGGYLGRVGDVYRELAASDPRGWHVVECSANGAVRPLDDISDDIWATVNTALSFSR